MLMGRVGSLTIEGFAFVVGLWFGHMVESMMQTALCRIDVFILSLRFVKLFNVHKLNRTFCLLSGQLLFHASTYTSSKLFIVEGSIKESLDNVLGKHSSHRCRFRTVRLNLRQLRLVLDECQLTFATWSSFTFPVGLGDMRRAIEATCSPLI